jgi:hypothetical protein
MSVRSAQAITTEFTTRNATSGVGVNADSLPTGTLVVNGTDNGATVTVTNVDTGRYKAAVTLPTLAVGDCVQLMIAATVNSVSDKAKVWEDTKDVVIDSSGRALSDIDTIKTNPVVNGGTITFPTGATLASTTNITAAAGCAVSSIGTDVINSTALAASAVTEIWAGSTAPTTAQIATGVWTDTTAGDFTTALSIGKSIMNGVSLGTGLTINGYTGNTPQTGDSFARIGANGVSLSAIPDLAGVTTLLSRLSSTRAGYLDNLSAGAVALAANLTGDPYAYLTTNMGLMGANLTAADDAVMSRLGAPAGASLAADIATTNGRLTSTRAGYLDNLNSGVPLAADSINSTSVAASGSAEIAVDVWAAATRTLTSGANIALAKGTGVTGFNDIAATDVWAATVRTLSDKTGFALTSAYDFAKGTVAMTESYPALGTVPTPAQSLQFLTQKNRNFAIVDTTWNVYKVDGTTLALTLSLNNSTTPSTLTQAT